MSTWELRNAVRKNVVGNINWINNKKYNDLLQELKVSGFIDDVSKYYVCVENFGLAFSVCERKLNSEVLYVKMKIEEQ